jgi:pilus assembly protein CpaB
MSAASSPSVPWMPTDGTPRRRREALAAWWQARRQWLLLGGALSMGALAAIGARSWISEQVAVERERLQPRQAMVSIVVARHDLPRGEVVGQASMAVREIPGEYLAPGTIVPEQFDGYAGARLTVPLRAGEPLLKTVLEGADPGTFAARVPAGVRAFTVMVDEVNSLSGMLQPGDRIDLLLSARPPATASVPHPSEVTRTLLQGIRVLATGRQVRPGAEERAGRGYGAITVEVTPDQAQRLVVAQRIGRLTAMLRNPDDRSPVNAAPVDAWTLLGVPPPAAASPAPAARVTELIVGGQGALRSGAAQSSPGAASPSASALASPFALPSALAAEAPAMPMVPQAAAAPAGPGASATPGEPPRVGPLSAGRQP